MPDKITVAIDASTLDAWDSCKMYYNLRINKRLTRGYKAKSLDTGGVLHYVMKNYYTLKKEGVRDILWEHKKDPDTGRIISFMDKYSVIDGAPFDFKRAVESSILIAYEAESDLSPWELEEEIYYLKGYFTKYEYENWQIHEVEKAFAVTLYDSPELKIIGQGIADIIGSTNAMELFIADHKKRSRREQENPYNHQRLMYTFALGIETFITNKIVFIKDPDRYMRQIDSYTPEHHREWIGEVVGIVKEILAYTKLGVFRRNPTSCDKYGGCQYKNFCNLPPSRRELRIGSEWFEGDVWDVGKILENSKVS